MPIPPNGQHVVRQSIPSQVGGFSKVRLTRGVSKECRGNRSRAWDTRWCDRLSPDHRRQISAQVFPVSDPKDA